MIFEKPSFRQQDPSTPWSGAQIARFWTPKEGPIEPKTLPAGLRDETATELNSERRRGASHEGHKDGFGRGE